MSIARNFKGGGHPMACRSIDLFVEDAESTLLEKLEEACEELCPVLIPGVLLLF